MRDELPFSCHFVKLAPAACHVSLLEGGWTHWGQINSKVYVVLFIIHVCLIWDSERMRDELPFSCHFVKLAPAACRVKVFLKEAGHSGAKSILD